MSWDKRCDNCVHSRPDWVDVNNSDHYCDNDVSDFNGKEVLTPSHCTWDIDDDLKSALNAKNPAARENAEFWSKQKLDHVEFMFSESRNYKYTV